jgi:hypothetical protein
MFGIGLTRNNAENDPGGERNARHLQPILEDSHL